MPTLLIVDDSALVRATLRFWLGNDSGWQICGEAENGQMAVEKVRELKPDAVLLDFAMPVMNGLEAARQIRVIAPKTAMVMFTLHNCRQLLNEAHAAGISDIVSKSEPRRDLLIAALRQACV